MTLFSRLFRVICSIPIFYVFAVLFGAPVFSSIEETLVFSFVLALFTTVPLIWCCNDDEDTFWRLVLEGRALNKSQFFAQRIATGSVLGSFCGTIVIPLDWDVYWQKWPIPCIIGIILGAILGIFCAQLQLLLQRKGVLAREHTKII